MLSHLFQRKILHLINFSNMAVCENNQVTSFDTKSASVLLTDIIFVMISLLIQFCQTNGLERSPCYLSV
ncbi:hypothetical protein FGO68_gene4095 [Halteria grandinella]|uniref:Uncharacterized protein n=1 Tax=Halteria grandinella TaxID=5974 RepID=A0A8J8NE89_HALGN|nr:hypothetical protein FGO68_gene4095 [Halteria grandinella]